MAVLLIIDMQAGLFSEDTPRYDAEGVMDHINQVAGAVRSSGGSVVFIQHDGQEGGILAPHTPGWELLASINREPGDLLIRKEACDAFYETDLEGILNEINPEPLIITGCATDLCVDTTVRAAASRDYQVLAVEDGHTTADRPHLKAEEIIRHHNWVWRGLILPHSRVKVLPASRVVNLIMTE